MILLPGLLPAPAQFPTWAVFADDHGEPYLEPVVCYGVFEVDEKGRRLVAAFTQGSHVESADFKPHFLTLTRTEDPAPWRQQCMKLRKEITEAKLKQKIVVPNDKFVQGVFGNNN